MNYFKSAFLRLDSNDFFKSIIIAFLSPIVLFLSSAIGIPGFTFSSLDFGMLIKIGIASMLAYLVKNVMSDDQGKFLGKIG